MGGLRHAAGAEGAEFGLGRGQGGFRGAEFPLHIAEALPFAVGRRGGLGGRADGGGGHFLFTTQPPADQSKQGGSGEENREEFGEFGSGHELGGKAGVEGCRIDTYPTEDTGYFRTGSRGDRGWLP